MAASSDRIAPKRRRARREHGRSPEPSADVDATARRARKKRRSKRPRTAAGDPTAPDARAGREPIACDAPPSWAGTGADRKRYYLGLAVTAAVTFAFYFATTCPAIGLGDTALLIDEMARLSVNSHVNNHRIAVFFGHLFTRLPFGELAFRANLMSTCFGTGAVVLACVLAHRLIGRLVPALLATFAIAVMQSLWWHSTIVENYAVNAVILLTVVLLLLRDEERRDSRLYYVACAVSGLGIVNHVQMGFLSVMVFVYAIAQRNKGSYGLIRRWLLMGGAYLVGLLPYLYVLVRDISRQRDATKVLYWAIGGDFTGRMFEFDLGQVSRDLLLHFLIQFPSPMLVFIVLGIDYLFAKKLFAKTNAALGVGFLINTLFFLQFRTWDQFAFLLPSFLIAGHFGFIGVRSALEWLGAPERAVRARWLRLAVPAALALGIAIPPWLYRQLPVWGGEPGFWHDRFNNIYTRNSHDCARYVADPNKRGWTDARQFVLALGERLPKEAVYVDDDARMFYPVDHYYQRYLGWRPDVRVTIMNSWGFENWGLSEDAIVAMADRTLDRRAVFLVSTRHPHLGTVLKLYPQGIVTERFDLDEERWIYRLRRLSADEKARVGGTLHPIESFVGRDVMARVPVLKASYRPEEALAVRVDFHKNEEPIPVEFLWRDAEGAEYFRSTPFTIEPGNTQLFSQLDRQGDRKPGRWLVEVRSRGELRDRVPFRIE